VSRGRSCCLHRLTASPGDIRERWPMWPYPRAVVVLTRPVSRRGRPLPGSDRGRRSSAGTPSGDGSGPRAVLAAATQRRRGVRFQALSARVSSPSSKRLKRAADDRPLLPHEVRIPRSPGGIRRRVALDSSVALIRLGGKDPSLRHFGGKRDTGRGAVAALSWDKRDYVCVLCGGRIAEGLARYGSVLCHDCRDELGIDATFESLRGTMASSSQRLWPGRRRRPLSR
jgi:hypothetical protein